MIDLVSVSGVCFVASGGQSKPAGIEKPKRKNRPRGERTRKEQQRDASRNYYWKHRRKALSLSPDDVVYLAGPMTGRQLLNYPLFFGLSGLIEKEFGCRVLNPARHPNGLRFEEYMELDLHDLSHANKVIFLNGWRKSRGAMIEHDYCVQHALPMYSQRSLTMLLKEKIKGI